MSRSAVLRDADDLLSDADRPRLVPLLGRAVRLVVLHECLEQAQTEPALPRPDVALREPAATGLAPVSRPDRRCSPAS